MLTVDRVSCGYKTTRRQNKVILQDISLQLAKGSVLCVLGTNGVGKTTLFKTILGTIPLLSGEIKVEGQNIKSLSKSRIAHKIGYVPQNHIPLFPYTVQQIVVMGRVSHLPLFAVPSTKDLEIAENALAVLGIAHLSEEVYSEISGGERQLVLIARALCQQAEYLIMDEPTANLDMRNQILVLRQVKRLAQAGIGVILTTHHPNHAFLCADSVIVIKNKNSYLIGKPEDIITQPLLEEMYGIDISLTKVRNHQGNEITMVVSHL